MTSTGADEAEPVPLCCAEGEVPDSACRRYAVARHALQKDHTNSAARPARRRRNSPSSW